jgi:hypothetical protein
MTARNRSILIAALLLLVACGPALTPAESQEQEASLRFLKASIAQHENDQRKLTNDLLEYCRAHGCDSGSVQGEAPYAFIGTTSDSKSPYDGKTTKVFERGVVATKHRGKTRVYDGQFLYFHAPPDKPNDVAIAFIGHVEDVDEPESRRFGLLVSEGFGFALILMETDQDYLDSLEKKYGDQVAEYKARVAEKAEQTAAFWSLGEALVVGMGSELLKTGDATQDELVKTGLEYGVAVARDGLDAATQQLLNQQKARLVSALEKAVEKSVPAPIAATLRVTGNIAGTPEAAGGTPGQGSPATGPLGGGSGVLGSCRVASTGMCTELRSGGDLSAFRDECQSQAGGSFSAASCSGNWSFSCVGAFGTSRGKRSPINIYFPAGFCEAHPNTDTQSTCDKLGGQSSGAPCARPG